MSMSTQQKNIDGKICIVVQYPGMEGLKIWTNLVKLLGPSLAMMGKALGGDIKDVKNIASVLEKDVDIESLFSVMSEALILTTDKMDEDLVERLVIRMLSGTKVDNREINIETFNLMFSGNYGMLFKVIAFTLKVNYSSFLGGKGHSTDTSQNQSLSSVPVSTMKT